MTLPRPIGSIARFAQIIGSEAAFDLAETHGGTRIYVPRKPAGTELERLIGEAGAAALAKHWPGEQVKVPVAREWRVVAYRARGMTYEQIALRLSIDRTTVYRILQEQDLVARQLDFFERG